MGKKYFLCIGKQRINPSCFVERSNFSKVFPLKLLFALFSSSKIISPNPVGIIPKSLAAIASFKAYNSPASLLFTLVTSGFLISFYGRMMQQKKYAAQISSVIWKVLSIRILFVFLWKLVQRQELLRQVLA